MLLSDDEVMQPASRLLSDDEVTAGPKLLSDDEVMGMDGPATWGDTLKAIPEQIVGGAQQAVGGLAQAAATEPEMDPLTRYAPFPLKAGLLAAHAGREAGQALLGDNAQRLDQFGREAYAKGAQRIEEATPENQSFWQQAVSSAGVSAGTMLPAGAAAFVLRSPGLVAGSFGVQEFGRAFGDAKAQGLDDVQATRHATASGLLEAGTEYLPAKQLFKAGTGPFKRLVNFMARELPGENIAELGQMVSERINGMDDEITAQQVVDTVKMTSAATLITGGSQSIAASGMDYLLRHRKKTPEEKDAEAITAITSAPDVDSAIDAATQSLDTATLEDLEPEVDLEQQLATLETPDTSSIPTSIEGAKPEVAGADSIYKSGDPSITPSVPATAQPISPEMAADTGQIPQDRRLDPQRAARGARRQFQTPDQFLEQRHREKVAKHKLSPEQAEAFKPSVERDDVVDYYQKRDLFPTIQRAQEHSEGTGEQAHYVEIDVANMGGGNKFYQSNQEFDKNMFIPMAKMLQKELEGTGGDVIMFRVGKGDELGAVIVNADEATIAKAMSAASEKTIKMARDLGMGDIENPKYAGSPERGINLYFGIAPILKGKTPDQVRGEADGQVNLNKLERNERGDGRTIEAERPGAPQGQTGGAEGRDTSSVGRVSQTGQEAGSTAAGNRGGQGLDEQPPVSSRTPESGSSDDAGGTGPREVSGADNGRTGKDSESTSGQRKTGEQVNEQRTAANLADKENQQSGSRANVSKDRDGGGRPDASDGASEMVRDSGSGRADADLISDLESGTEQTPDKGVSSIRKPKGPPRFFTAKQASDRGYISTVSEIDEFNRLIKAMHAQGREFDGESISELREITKEKTDGKPEDQKTRQATDAESAEVLSEKPAGKLPKPESAEPAQKRSAPKGKAIEDFGQKLEGAKKDRVITLADDLKDEELASQPLSKIWPADEYEQYEDPFTAAVAFAARYEIPAKPRKSYKLKRWIESVKTVRSLAQSIATGQITRAKLLEKMDSVHSLKQFANKIRVLEAIPRGQWKRIDKVELYPEAISYVGNKKEPNPFSTFGVDGKYTGLQTADIDRVIEAVKEKLGNQEATETRMVFEVRGRPGNYSINKKGDREYRHLKEFSDDSANKALAYVRDNYADLVKAWEGVKDRDNVKEKDLRRDVNRPRAGSNWRKGKDISPEKFQETFGFRGGQFGNWVSQGAGAKERQGLLNQAYDAFMDLATILGIPPKSISLNGTLGIAFGARGHGWASAHFEPGNLVINLTKPRGAGALGHEWFHALDNYFARMRNEGNEVRPTGNRDFQQAYREANFITYRPEPMMVHVQTGKRMTKPALEAERARNPELNFFAAENWQPSSSHPEGVRPEVESRWADLVKALNESPMAARARKIDKGPNGYWSQIIERGARSFENYLISKMAQEGYHNDYLANVVGPTDFKRDPGRYPYLMPDEVAPIAEAVDNLFGELKTKETDKGVALYSKQSVVPAGTKPTGLPVPEVQKIVDEFRAGLKGVPGAEYAVAGTQKEAFGSDAREADVVKAGYYPKTGKIVLVAGNLSSRQEVLRALRHETLAHFGLNTLPAETKAEIIQKITESRDTFSLKKIWESVDRDYAELSEELKAEEVMARIAEDPMTRMSKLWNDILRLIEEGLRKIGMLKAPITKTELREMVEAMAERIRGGNQRRSADEQPAFSKESRAYNPDKLTDAERKFFNNLDDSNWKELQEAAPSIEFDGEKISIDQKDIDALADWIDDLRISRDGGEDRLPPSFYSADFAFRFRADSPGGPGSQTSASKTAPERAVSDLGQMDLFGDSEVVDGSGNPVGNDKRASALELYASGLSSATVAKRIGDVSVATVKRWVSDARIQRSASEARGGTAERKEKAIELYQSGLGAFAVADMVGVSNRAIYNWLKEAGVKIRSMSEAQSLRAAQGRQPIRGVRSTVSTKWGDIRADSVYEAARLRQLEQDSSVADVTRATESIPWGENSRYTPDFIVTMEDGSKRVEEIKPTFQEERQDVLEKAEAAREFFGNDGVDYLIINTEALSDGFEFVSNMDGLSFSSEEDKGRFKRSLSTARSAAKASSTFDPSDPNILYSKQKVAPVGFQNWTLPNTMSGTFSSLMTKKDKLLTTARQIRRKMQDKHIVWRDVQEQIGKSGGTLSDFSDAYNKFTLIEGKIGDRFKKLFDDHIEPIIKDLTLSGVTIEQLGDYLYAKFAPQRNKRIADINPDMPDGGSGLTNAEAQKILAGFTAAETKQLERLAQKVYAMQKFKLDTLVDAGRLTSEVRDELLKDDRYVPLKGFAATEELVTDTGAVGRGFDQAKDVFKRAKGRKTLAAELLSTSVRDVENAIISAEKNRVGQSILKLVMDNPNENLWKVNPIKIEKAFNKASGQVEQRVISDYKALARDPNVFVTWVKGKPYAIEFRDNPMGESSLARAVKNMGVDNIPKWATYLSKLNRWLSAANTALSPEFMLTNPIRDIQTALAKTYGDYDARIAGNVMKNLPKAIKGAIGGIGESKAAQKVAAANPQLTAYFNEYAAEGGKTDYFRTKTVNEMRNELDFELAAAAKGKKGAAIRAIRSLKHGIENSNAVLENMTRLSLYITLREAGYSKHKAATAARNLTVNFARKGEAGAFINSLYLFYNASMQGTALTLRLMRNPKVQKLLVAAGAGMVALTQFNILAGGDDDDGEANYFKIPPYERERNIIIMWPDGSGRYTKFPMPYGLNVPMNAAASIAHMANGRDPLKEALWLAGSAWNSFSPVGENGWNIVAPTVLDPFVDIALNRNYAGNRIMPEDNPYDAMPPPDSEKAFGSTHPGYKAVARFMNEMTGGNEQKPGWIDISPESIQHLTETYTGAAGGFLNRVVKYASDTELFETETSRAPFIRKFYGEPSPYSAGQSYRDNKANILYYKERLDFLKEKAKEHPMHMADVEKFKKENAEGLALVRALEGAGEGKYRIKGSEDKLRDLYKDRKKYEAQGNKEKVKETNDKIEAEQRKFNSKYNAVFLDRGIVEELGLLKLKAD